MRINAKNKDRIKVDGQDIEDVKVFAFLEATVRKEERGMRDLENIISKARGAFVRLKKMWRSNKILTKTKLRLYKVLVSPVLLYRCETTKQARVPKHAPTKNPPNSMARTYQHFTTTGTSYIETAERGCEVAKMKADWPHTTAGSQ